MEYKEPDTYHKSLCRTKQSKTESKVSKYWIYIINWFAESDAITGQKCVNSVTNLVSFLLRILFYYDHTITTACL